MDLSAIALQGLQQAEIQLDTAASRLVQAGAASPDGANLDTVSLSEELVALMTAQSLYDVNLTSLKTADQVQKSLLDITA